MNPALSALERTVLPGTRLGRYEIITHLAAGGMATVFLGRALGAAGFHRLVAIKLLHPHVAADQQFITMFLDEARLAARIRHPNVVPTLDLQHGPEGHYLVMEFIEGESLLGLLRQGALSDKPLPAPIAIRVVLDILAGLHAAHELTGDLGEPLNLVHRDVSPHNILVGVDGTARIVDFGIARAEERIGTTRDGQVKGKLAYMAPEQTTSEPVDRRVDVFAAAIVLWETLTGRRLFRGQSDAEVLRKLLEKPIPRLRDVSPSYPEALCDVCARALNRDPAQRFDTTADFAEALEQAAAPLGIATPKQVAAYVRAVAGESIDNMMRRARAFQEGSKVPDIGQHLEIADNPDSSVRVANVAAGSTPMGIVSTASGDGFNAFNAKELAASDGGRSRRPFVVGVAAAALVLAGAIIATLTLVVASSPSPNAVTTHESLSLSASLAHPAPEATHAPTAPADLTAHGPGASVDVTDLPHIAGDSRAHPVLPRRPMPIPSASATPQATQVSTPPPVVTQAAVKPPPPAPTNTTFNPESM